MKEWLVEHPVTQVMDGKYLETLVFPNDGVRAQKISKEMSTVSLDRLSVVEQYVLGIFHFLNGGISYPNDGTSKILNDLLLRLMGMTRKGRVWMKEGIPVTLQIQEVTNDSLESFRAHISQGKMSRVVNLLFQKQDGQEEPWERMVAYRVRKELVKPLRLEPDLRQICEVMKEVVFPEKKTMLHLSGWNLNDMDEPHEVIRMLSDCKEEVVLYVRPSNGKVHYIRLE